ncbi:MAG: hypothetical protein R3F31_04780 [Verrucomicrobiales bacterium]|nr:hypothetical protein [Verrucomicrobiae bacterium]MCP5553387.1 hypothetical protein [Akkermansiaceae bacterium]
MNPSDPRALSISCRVPLALLACLILAGILCSRPGSGGELMGKPADLDDFPGAPHPLNKDSFGALLSHSPFLRSLNLSDSLLLTGIARIGGEIYVTLLDRETKESYTVSGSANAQGWRLVGITGDEADLKSVTAEIAIAGGGICSVRFDERQLKPGEGKPAGGSGRGPGATTGAPTSPRDYREGISGDGFRGPPPPELVKKLSQLGEDQRQELIRKIGEIRDKNRELSSADRQVMFVRMVDRALQEKR